MRNTMFAVATAAAVLMAVPLVSGTVRADSVRLAQVDVDVGVGRPGPRVEEHRRDVEIKEHRRPGVVIEETEGRRPRDCVTHSESETRNGVTVTEKERNCAR
jgi:hypothetical protein